jgi:hypothetical protein
MLAAMRTTACTTRLRAPHPFAIALLVLLVAGIGGGAGGCASKNGAGGSKESSDAVPTPTPGDPDLITHSGTVRWLDLEGGFYGIVADDSTKYDPIDLDARFRRDGLRVRFDARRATNQMSIRQWGTLVTIVRIDSL